MSTTKSSEMKLLIKELIKLLKYSIIVEPIYGHSHAVRLYELVHKLGRKMYIFPDYRDLLTEEDITALKEIFQPAFVSIADYTRGLLSDIESHDLNIAKTRLSQIYFFKNEIFDLYKEIDKAELTAEVVKAIQHLETDVDMLESQISVWSDPDYEWAEEDPDDVPNLNGVPESHFWWSKEQRESSKNNPNQSYSDIL